MLERMYKKTVPLIACETLKNNHAEFIILDTREQAEFRVSHIQNSKWIGYDDFDTHRLEGVPKDANLVVYCSVGYRSERIGEKLLALGYTNVKNLYGGIFEWVNEDGKVYNSTNKETKDIHAFNMHWGIWLQKGLKVY